MYLLLWIIVLNSLCISFLSICDEGNASPSPQGILDYLDNLTVIQIRKLFGMLSTLAFSNQQDGGLIQVPLKRTSHPCVSEVVWLSKINQKIGSPSQVVRFPVFSGCVSFLWNVCSSHNTPFYCTSVENFEHFHWFDSDWSIRYDQSQQGLGKVHLIWQGEGGWRCWGGALKIFRHLKGGLWKFVYLKTNRRGAPKKMTCYRGGC